MQQPQANMSHDAENKMKFIVCAPRYDDTSGGSIVLHKLAEVLGVMGHEALLWPLHRVHLRPHPFSAAWWRRCVYAATRIYRPLYSTKPGLPLKLAKESDIDNAIVIYPEIVSGNPLKSRKYVRWLLHRKGHHVSNTKFKHGDLYFCYQEAFNDHHEGLHYGGVLRVLDLMLDVYSNTNPGERSGTCFMIRKGKSRRDLPSFRGKLVVDGVSHQALAKIFNEKKYCYFYDPYTAYSSYAAVCGCIPVIIPPPDLRREDWEPAGGRKPGIAYGCDDIPYAIASRQILLDRMTNAEKESIESTKRFINTVRDHFYPTGSAQMPSTRNH